MQNRRVAVCGKNLKILSDQYVSTKMMFKGLKLFHPQNFT